MGYQLTFLGLMNFHDITPEGALVLLPNGIRYGSRIPDHFARFFLMTNQVRGRESNWWDPIANPVMSAVGVTVYPIETWCDLTISGMEERQENRSKRSVGSGDAESEDTLDASQFLYVPPLSGLDIEPVEADTIAQLPIRRGTLCSFRLAESEVGTLTVEQSSGPITITASPRDGSPIKRLVLEDESEILLSNMSDLFRGRPAEGGVSHYKIYSRLDRERRPGSLNEPDIDPRLTPLFPDASSHPFVEWIRENFGDIPRPGCGLST